MYPPDRVHRVSVRLGKWVLVVCGSMRKRRGRQTDFAETIHVNSATWEGFNLRLAVRGMGTTRLSRSVCVPGFVLGGLRGEMIGRIVLREERIE